MSSTWRSDNPLGILLAKYYRQARAKLDSRQRTARLTLLAVFVLSLVSGVYGAKAWQEKRHQKQPRREALLQRNSGLLKADGSRIIFVPYRASTAKVVIYPTKPTTFDAHRRFFLSPPRAVHLGNGLSSTEGLQFQSKPGLNLHFLHQFLGLWSIMVPRWNSKESGLLFTQGLFLVLRTYLSLLVARLDGEIVRDLVAGNGRAFTMGLVKWFGVGGFASYTNAGIKYLQNKVSISFRTRLTRYVHDIYLNDELSYYKLTNLDGGIGQRADQFIAQDLTLFCSSTSSLFSNIGKPLFDLLIFNYQLYRSLGPLALTGLLANYFVTATILRKLSPPLAQLAAIEGRYEGNFRALHSRVLANAEEIAFYGGGDVEKLFVEKSFRDLKAWVESIYQLRIQYNMLEDFVLKYSWSAFGYLMTSLPVFLPLWGGSGDQAKRLTFGKEDSERGRMKEFITNRRLMLSLADSGGRLMFCFKDLSQLAGYTSRVWALLSTLHRVHAQAYVRNGEVPELYSLSDVQGTLHRGYNGIRLEDAPIIAPAPPPKGGIELIKHLSFAIQSGDHLFVSGGNSSGKTSLVRMIAGVWPVYRGLVSTPRMSSDKIMTLPQRPYFRIGSLRDNVIYPHSVIDMHALGIRDEDLISILEEVHLDYLPAREGGWDVRKQWDSVLSGGERQRMAFARVLYHNPTWAVVDDGTSAVSSDVESLLYERTKAHGITLLTISTRASLAKYHRFELRLGLGPNLTGWKLEEVGNANARLGFEKELYELRQTMEQVESWKQRKKVIEEELSQVWVGDEPLGCQSTI